MKYYEGLKKKNLPVEEYTSYMKDENNIIEIDGLKTCFFTDNGTVMSVNGVSFNIPKIKLLVLLVNQDVVKALHLYLLCN